MSSRMLKEKLKCNMCRKEKSSVKFIGKNGQVTKTCDICRKMSLEKNKINFTEKKKLKEKKIINKCLKCGKEFKAKSKYNRICDKCKEISFSFL